MRAHSMNLRASLLSLFSLSTTALLLACSSGAPGNGSTITARNQDEADEIQQQYDVQCADSSNCNPSVGLLIARMDDVHIGLCTSSLIAPDIVLTNKHCLPPDIQEAGADCFDWIGFKYPGADGASFAKAECSKVLAISPYSVAEDTAAKQQTDYAILQLVAAPGRPTVTIDRSGVFDGEPLTVFRMSPDNGRRVGTIAPLACHAVMNTVVTPVYSTPQSPVVELNNCDIVHGNSGSPIFGANGAVKALVMQGAANLDGMRDLGVSDPKPWGRATNLACLNEPGAGFGASLSANCGIDLSDNGLKARSDALLSAITSNDKIQALFSAKVTELSGQEPQNISWSLAPQTIDDSDKRADIASKALLVPSCFQPRTHGQPSWLDAYRSNGNSFAASASEPVSINVLEAKLSLDAEYRPALSVVVLSDTGELMFSPSNIDLNNQSSFKMGKASNDWQAASFTLQACPSTTVSNL